MRFRSIGRMQGFTLVELMVGLTVGLFVALAAISVFVSTRTLQTVSSAESRMGENVRLAMDMLRKDFRAAGFQGCYTAQPISLLTNSNGLFLDAAGSAVGGSHGNGSAFSPLLNTTLSALPQPPLPDSDVFSLRVPVEPMALALTTDMASPTAAPSVGVSTAGNTIASGDIVVLSNCLAGAIFQVTEASPATTGLLTHATSVGYPGNAAAALPRAFDRTATVYRLQTHHYYIANSVQRPGTTSLWRYVFPGGGAQEVVEGVDRMLVTYGVDNGTQAAPTVNAYYTADSVPGTWDTVVAARVQLLASTVNHAVTLSAQPASFAGGTVAAVDRRFRQQLTEVVTLRNQAP